jgi:hypothetical protein
MAMAERMARTGPWGAAPEPSPTPPPPPGGARRWHVAAEGKATGPYTRDELGRLVSDGSVTGDSWLWTPGGPDWQRGRDVSDLADLFSAPPPPPAA